jgi:hypothetical protein
MTREQAEANWIFDPKCGDVRPADWPKGRRLPCTPANVRAQRKLARPGTLIHTMAKTTCPRKKAKTDELIEGGITYSAEASFIENVNCLTCRRDYFRKVN